MVDSVAPNLGFGVDTSGLERTSAALANLVRAGQAAGMTGDQIIQMLGRLGQQANNTAQLDAKLAESLNQMAKAMAGATQAAGQAEQMDAKLAQTLQQMSRAMAGATQNTERHNAATRQAAQGTSGWSALLERFNGVAGQSGSHLQTLQNRVQGVGGTIVGGGGLNSALGSAAPLLGRLTQGLGGAAAGAGLLAGGLIAVGASAVAISTPMVAAEEKIMLLNAQFKAVYGNAMEAADAISMIREVAGNTGMAVDAVSSSFLRLARNNDMLGLTKEELKALTEEIINLGRLGGKSSFEVQGAMLQLSQALSAGKLNGDELRSIMENMPELVKAIADGMDVPVGKIKAMGAAGQLTSDIIIAALQKQQAEVARQAKELPITTKMLDQQIADEWEQMLARLSKSTGLRGIALSVKNATLEGIRQASGDNRSDPVPQMMSQRAGSIGAPTAAGAAADMMLRNDNNAVEAHKAAVIILDQLNRRYAELSFAKRQGAVDALNEQGMIGEQIKLATAATDVLKKQAEQQERVNAANLAAKRAADPNYDRFTDAERAAVERVAGAAETKYMTQETRLRTIRDDAKSYADQIAKWTAPGVVQTEEVRAKVEKLRAGLAGANKEAGELSRTMAELKGVAGYIKDTNDQLDGFERFGARAVSIWTEAIGLSKELGESAEAAAAAIQHRRTTQLVIDTDLLRLEGEAAKRMSAATLNGSGEQQQRIEKVIAKAAELGIELNVTAAGYDALGQAMANTTGPDTAFAALAAYQKQLESTDSWQRRLTNSTAAFRLMVDQESYTAGRQKSAEGGTQFEADEAEFDTRNAMENRGNPNAIKIAKERWTFDRIKRDDSTVDGLDSRLRTLGLEATSPLTTGGKLAASRAAEEERALAGALPEREQEISDKFKAVWSAEDEAAAREMADSKERQIKAMKEEMDLGMLLGKDRKDALELLKEEATIRDRFPGITEAEVRAHLDKTRELQKQTEEYERQQEQIRDLESVTDEMGDAMRDGLSDLWDDFFKDGEVSAESFWQFVESVGTRTMNKIVNDMIIDPIVDWLQDTVKQVMQMIIKAVQEGKIVGAITDFIGTAIGGITGSPVAGAGAGNGSSAVTTTPMTRGAYGLALDGRAMRYLGYGDVIDHARGSVHDRPVRFMSAGGPVEIGEAGPEAVLPLKRGPDGKLGVGTNGGGGDGGGDVSVTIIDQRGSGEPASVKQSRGPDGKRILEVMIKDAVQNGMANGDYDNVMSERYGSATRITRR